MQATISVRRSPLTMLVILSTLFLTLVVGAVAGYVAKGLQVQGAPNLQPIATHARAISSTGSSSYRYVQGGRPAVVYEQVSPIVAAPTSAAPECRRLGGPGC